MKKIISLVCAFAVSLGAISFFAPSGAAEDYSDALTAAAESTVVIDRSTMTLRRICGTPTVSELLAEFTNDPSKISVTAADGRALGADESVVSGSVVSCAYSGGEEKFTALIYGDLNSDGRVDMKDVITLIRVFSGWDISRVADTGDVDLNGKENMTDLVLIIRYLSGWDVTLGPVKIVYTEDAQIAPDEDSTLSLLFGNNLDKINRNIGKPSGKTTATLRLAKNEIEFTQLYLYSENDAAELSISVSDFISQKGKTLRTEIYSEFYFEMEDAATGETVSYPDALPPVSDGFKVSAGTYAGFVIKAFTDADDDAGLYRATVSVKKDGKTVKTAYVFARVWDFALSDDTACETAFGMSRYNIYNGHRQYASDEDELYIAYYDYMIENRVSPYYLPCSVLDDKADEYMSNPRVTSFMIDGRDTPNGELTDDEMRQAYEKLSAKPEWMSKGYFYYVDEPNNFGSDNFGTLTVAQSADRLKRLFPDYRLVVPYYTNVRNSNGLDMTETLANAGVNLWCPVSSFWTPWDTTATGANIKLDRQAVETYGTAEERFARYVEKGDELWWYVCIQPQYPYANLFATYQGTMSRVLMWQQYKYNVKGLLYWSVNAWSNGAEWRKIDAEFPYGDGRLIYCGKRYGLYGPIGSIRLEYLRDGIEDFQYLTMIEELYGREKADEIVARVTKGILDTHVVSGRMTDVRNEMGDLIEAAMKK